MDNFKANTFVLKDAKRPFWFHGDFKQYVFTDSLLLCRQSLSRLYNVSRDDTFCRIVPLQATGTVKRKQCFSFLLTLVYSDARIFLRNFHFYWDKFWFFYTNGWFCMYSIASLYGYRCVCLWISREPGANHDNRQYSTDRNPQTKTKVERFERHDGKNRRRV